ncbi:Uncharacterized protein K02A2.6 [Stylophora pistillata]|uniref:Uncharacterized protein K02A2.6 n=1 Tax=Stylophora pistillata TaxID=50429 RepID=A0A2B4RUD9_STYPI|nr:Uncharacterized protein K02A2.6 [Stylophora pistillata]
MQTMDRNRALSRSIIRSEVRQAISEYFANRSSPQAAPTERFVQTFKRSLESSASDPSCTLQQRIQNFLLSYRSTQHATTGSFPAILFLQRELRTRLSLVRPDLATDVSHQQVKMKMHYDKHAKFREVAVGDTVLARDHLSGQKWQPGTVVQRPSSHSCQVHLDDWRVWRRHVDDVLQNSSHSTTAESGVPSLETATLIVPEPKPVSSPETSSHPPDNSAQSETTPAFTSPMLRHRPALTDIPRDRLRCELNIINEHLLLLLLTDR